MGNTASQADIIGIQNAYARKTDLTTYPLASTVYTKSDVDTKLGNYYPKADVDTKFAAFVPGVIDKNSTVTCNADGTCTLPPNKSSTIDFMGGNPKSNRTDPADGTINYGKFDAGGSLNIVGGGLNGQRNIGVWGDIKMNQGQYYGKVNGDVNGRLLGVQNIADTRNDNKPPNSYPGKSSTYEFKDTLKIGLPTKYGATWGVLHTIRGWEDGSVKTIQFLYTEPGAIFYRFSNSETEWNANWYKATFGQ